MSLVEQAIARMKWAAKEGQVERKPVGEVNVDSSVAAGVEGEESVSSNKKLSIDLAALQASGYLPEPSRERQFAEHYRKIKRPLIERVLSRNESSSERSSRIIMVTSALPGDGKTFTSLNLALSIARERDVSVLLVDADGLKQHVSSILGIKHEPGLIDVLADEKVRAEALVLRTNVRGLSLLPAGQFVEGTAELFSSVRMRDTLESLIRQDHRRIVLLDSPPLLLTNESRGLVKLVGQLALVVRAGLTPKSAVKECIGLFENDQAGGIIVNDGRMAEGDGYYGYGAYGRSVDDSGKTS